MLRDDGSFTVCIVLRSSSPPNHLNEILRRELHPTTLIWRIDLRSLDYDTVGWKIDTPGQCRCTNKDLNVFTSEQIFYCRSIGTVHSGMMNCETIWQQILQVTVV